MVHTLLVLLLRSHFRHIIPLGDRGGVRLGNLDLGRISSITRAPGGDARHVDDVLELAAKLDNRVADQAGVETHGTAQGVLGARRGIEAYDEVVSSIVGNLVLAEWLGQLEDAPVGDTAHNAAAVEDDAAGSLGDSIDTAEGPESANSMREWEREVVFGGMRKQVMRRRQHTL